MDKKSLSEEMFCTKLIYACDWKSRLEYQKQVRGILHFTDGRVIVQGSLHN